MGAKILVVDDSEDFRDVLCAHLRIEGFEVPEASDGDEALIQAEAFSPDVILSDVRMPRCGGIQLARAASRNKLKQIPIILMSGYVGDEKFDRESYPNVVEILSKPIKLDKLIYLLRTRLQSGRRPDATQL